MKVAINKFKLRPVPIDSLVAEDVFVAFETISERSQRIVRKLFPRGIRIAHFHFEKDVYLLIKEQWKGFSGNIIRDFQEKLAKVNDM